MKTFALVPLVVTLSFAFTLNAAHEDKPKLQPLPNPGDRVPAPKVRERISEDAPRKSGAVQSKDEKALALLDTYCMKCHDQEHADPDNDIPKIEGFMALKAPEKKKMLDEMLKHMHRHVDERKPMPPLDFEKRKEFETPGPLGQPSDKQILVDWMISQGGELKDPYYKR